MQGSSNGQHLSPTRKKKKKNRHHKARSNALPRRHAMYINIQLDASSGQRTQNLIKPGCKQGRKTLEKKKGTRRKGIAQKEAIDERWEIPQPSLASRSRKKKLGSRKKRLTYEA
ncbi:hypothetical protein PDIG_32900 [Penicillium digitatum PHI26]|uniref:Uncharacterized protein n=1 Tax=Penicillium digitatum (strain PHI26 / CECT 20796) TaxID=1170229 RepID=K9FZ79_PEND2|nr:hypothetical protein PDIG_32900 [Penicillium digitatum PHI26]